MKAATALSADAFVVTAVRALCRDDHDGPCLYPSCSCTGAMRREYSRTARIVLIATLADIGKELAS